MKEKENHTTNMPVSSSPAASSKEGYYKPSEFKSKYPEKVDKDEFYLFYWITKSFVVTFTFCLMTLWVVTCWPWENQVKGFFLAIIVSISVRIIPVALILLHHHIVLKKAAATPKLTECK